MALNINNNYQTGEVPNNTNNGQQKDGEMSQVDSVA